MNDVVFDSWPLMAYFDDEPPAEAIEELFKQIHTRKQRKLITVINVGEIWYNYARIFSTDFADSLTENLRKMNFTVVTADWPLTKLAAQFKVPGGISYADCFAAALAKSRDAPLVTGDREFEQLEGEIDIKWV